MSGKAVFGGSVDAEGAAKALVQLFRSGYASGLAVSQRGAGANMSVDVSVGGGLPVTAAGIGYYGWISSIENVTGLTADPTNPRRAIIVAYIDLALISTGTTNNVGAFKFLAVLGTAAASPSNPSDPTIQSAVGSGNPYIKLGQVQIGAGATSVVNANITDLRSPMALQVPYVWGGSSNSKGHLVPNVADDTVVLANATQSLAGKTLVAPTIQGPTTGVWYDELGRTTLAVAGDTITVNSLPTRKYLRIVAEIIPSGTLETTMRFNNDSGANYAERISGDFGAAAVGTSGTALTVDYNNGGWRQMVVIDMMNIAAQEKTGRLTNSQDINGAANAPSGLLSMFKWANSSVAVTRVDFINAGAGDFAIGSEVVVLGHD